ncbi:uncharacterized protein G2W53_028592 [Senna tora]|uniref:Uncharacterized protein n=1 Tax=Senna tora TaxID=362788 RepID=A0A834WAX1_9FABA|nr:uncharacterized protein G2W53_028592 [Senna tora]
MGLEMAWVMGVTVWWGMGEGLGGGMGEGRWFCFGIGSERLGSRFGGEWVKGLGWLGGEWVKGSVWC